MKDSEIFRNIAMSYVETDGEILKQELSQLTQEKSADISQELRMRARINEVKKKRLTIKAASMAATAAAVLFLVISIAPNFFTNNADYEMDYSAEETYQTTKAQIGESSQSNYKVVPLSFTLPQNLTVAGMEQDKGQSIYYLQDIMGDDVVLILEETDRPAETESMRLIYINGLPVYVRETNDYNLATLKKDGILYTMSCKYELDTLTDICMSL